MKSPILSHVNFLANDGDQLIDDVISLWGTFQYRLNPEELSYLRFIGRRYAVTELLIDSMVTHESDESRPDESVVVTT